MALLVAAVFWLWLWGPIGLLLSAPLTVLLVVLGKHVPALKFADVLLGDQPALGPSARYYQRLLAGDQEEAELLVEDYLRSHRPETVYDEVLLPAVVRTRIDREVQEVTADEERTILQATRELLENVLAHVGPVSPEALGETPVNVNGRSEAPRLECRVVGCAVHGRLDELALTMFGQLLLPTGAELEEVSAKELLQPGRFNRDDTRPDVICVASVPPGGLTRTASLCKQLKARFPEAKVVVGRWGQREEVEETRQHLSTAGADAVGVSLLETRGQLLALEGTQPDPAHATAVQV